MKIIDFFSVKRRPILSEKLIIDSFYKTIVNGVYDMIYLHDLEGNILDVNQKALSNIGYSREELKEMKVFDLHPSSDADIYDRDKIIEQWAEAEVEATINIEREHISKIGKIIPVEISTGKVGVDNQKYMLAFVRDISLRKEKEEKIEYLSYHDFLTGLFNRRYFSKELAQITEEMLPLSILMGDLNGLKIVNNSHGHSTGDKILIKAAKILEESIPEDAVLARFGGDEFAVMLPNTDNFTAHQILGSIKERCSQTESDDFVISIGMGISTMIDLDEDIEDIFKKADREMNQNKLLETRSANNKIIKGLLSALRAKSDETVEHTERMTELANKMGVKLGIYNSQLNRLSLLAALHDIGKTSIPEKVLMKPSKLNDEEWEMIKGHPARGYKIASATSEFAVVAEEILSHHERWDGGGYPRGLKAEKIPYLARIISIVDAYDVMTSGRPYQTGISSSEALNEIRRCEGTQFDPELAEEFIELMS
jgi:diguanylate cyclase (GGDEF)-like protein/PAS domain S-box-containing protein